jgi:micrococcal nuclease
MKKWGKWISVLFIILIVGVLAFKLGSNYQKERQSEEKSEWPELVRVIDGDTIEVKIDDKIESVRLIGIDAIELGTKEKEEIALKSKKELENILKDTKFRMEKDESQSNRDIYGRLLRYIFLEDGLFVNKEMLIRGMAEEYTFILPYQYQKEFQDVKRAR